MVFLGVEHGSVRFDLAECLCDLEGSLRMKASVMGRRAVPLISLCPGIRLTTKEKRGKPESRQPNSPGLFVAPNWQYLWDCIGWPAGRQITPVSQVTSVSPRSAQVPSELPYYFIKPQWHSSIRLGVKVFNVWDVTCVLSPTTDTALQQRTKLLTLFSCRLKCLRNTAVNNE
jgi:hypothetical protein